MADITIDVTEPDTCVGWMTHNGITEDITGMRGGDGKWYLVAGISDEWRAQHRTLRWALYHLLVARFKSVPYGGNRMEICYEYKNGLERHDF